MKWNSFKKYGKKKLTIKERWDFFCGLYPNHHENHTHDLMVSVLAPSSVDRRFKPWSDQTKDYKIGICCFSAKHAALRRKIKDWLSLNQYKVSEWSEMSICGLLFRLT